ncbi:uncharacterized protein LOC126630299 [Malus sylvestris]|uniref:uncharacterized protein n=1 Tax=Malus domestica TaxID=3750 RepID=UPI0004992966|nr:uncharacterized protein LOC103440118 [Malus domestica]XP_050156345.1 uncharacterized protein LOC126630299 [Malus sylvestris]
MSSCHNPPLLLIQTPKKPEWNLYNPIEDKVLGLQLKFPNKRLRGSSKGWLIAVNLDFVVTLINPFLRVKGRQKRADSVIDLPPLACPDNMSSRRKTTFVNKATLSADPILEADKCIVMVIHERERTGNNLAFFRLTKDTSWTYVVDETLRSLQDVHVGSKSYVVKEMGTLFSFDITSDQSISDKQLVAADTLECFQKYVKTYIVVLDDNELLMVQRVVEFDDGGRWTKEVRIFKLNFDMYKWIETETLGDVALFLGDNFSTSVKASNFSGCLPNCIYFNYDFDCVNSYPKHRLDDDYGVYDIESRSYSQTYTPEAKKLRGCLFSLTKVHWTGLD